MELKLALDEKQLDNRLRDRLIGEGKIKKEDVDKMLKNLPDDGENLTTVEQVKSTKTGNA
jgi:hypothetical protein